jgi:hypothetical protein
MKRKSSKIEDFFTTKKVKSEEAENQAPIEENVIDEAENVKTEIPQNYLLVNLEGLNENDNELAKKRNKNFKKDELKCIPCDKIFSNKRSLSCHNWKNHNNREKFPCKKCKNKFSSKATFDAHKCAECSICWKVFKYKSKLLDHQRINHSKELKLEKFTCDLCAKQFGEHHSIKAHIEEFHSELEAKFKCGNHCVKSFRTNHFYQQHLVRTKRKKCKICQRSVIDLKKHLHQVHGTNETPYECLVCSKRFKSKSTLKEHDRTHDKQFKCEFCPRKFAQNYQLIHHLNLHENPDDFKCSICQLVLSRKNNLKNHMKIHDKNRKKNLKCEQCDFATDAIKKFKKHQKFH